MSKTALVRTLIGIITSIAATGGIVGPIVAYSRSRPSSSRVVSSSIHQASTLTEGEEILGNSEELSADKLSGDELINQINQKYKSEGSSPIGRALPGTDKLKTIIYEGQPTTEKTWQLIKQNGETCEQPSRTMESFCGFIYLKRHQREYKLRVAMGNEGKGNVRVAKKEGDQVSYYDNLYEQGKQKTNNFEKLSFDKQSFQDSDPGQEYQNAIIMSQ